MTGLVIMSLRSQLFKEIPSATRLKQIPVCRSHSTSLFLVYCLAAASSMAHIFLSLNSYTFQIEKGRLIIHTHSPDVTWTVNCPELRLWHLDVFCLCCELIEQVFHTWVTLSGCNHSLLVCVCVVCTCVLQLFYFLVCLLFVNVLSLFMCCSFVVCMDVTPHPPPSHSCRRQNSWRESDTGSTHQSPSTLSPTPLSSRLTSTHRPKVQAKRPTAPWPRPRPALISHQRRLLPQHRPKTSAPGLCLRSRRSRESRARSLRALIRRMVLISVWLKMNRLKRIKLLQQRRVSSAELPVLSSVTLAE